MSFSRWYSQGVVKLVEFQSRNLQACLDQARRPHMAEEPNEKKPSWYGWLLILLPPFLLLPLSGFSVHMGSVFLFLAAGFIFLFSLLRLIAWLFQWVWSKSRKIPFPPQYARIRSILTLVIFVLVVGIQVQTRKQADQFVLDLGSQIQEAGLPSLAEGVL